MTQTYGSKFPAGKGGNYDATVGYHTNGGYTTSITVDDQFVFHIPDNMEMEYVGVLLCAGITGMSNAVAPSMNSNISLKSILTPLLLI